MKIHLVSLFIAFTVLAGCGPETQLPSLSNNAVILAFGDSLTHETGAKKPENYLAILEKLINRKVVNASIPEEISESGLKRLPK